MDGDPSKIPESARLVWPTLPQARPLPVAAPTAGTYRVDDIENPPVNPIVSHARSANEVRADLREHHDEQRKIAARNGAVEPMYRTDYVLFTPQLGGPVALGRVQGAPFGGAEEEADLVELAEYEHTPDDHTAGLFGTFIPMPNENYQKGKKGSVAFIRHRDVTRAHILVYNVQMWGPTKAQRITLAALRALSIARRDHPLPDIIPSDYEDGHDSSMEGEGNDANAAQRQRNKHAGDPQGSVFQMYNLGQKYIICLTSSSDV